MESTWPLTWSVVAFAGAAGVTVFGGIRLSKLGDLLADRTGWGEALFGAVFFGGVISLSGIVMTATAAWDGHAGLAYGSAVGGIAAQTVAVVAADIALRRANLEHAAASLSNILSGAILISLLAIALAASHTPAVTLWGVHPASIVLPLGYVLGLRYLRSVKEEPMWLPRQTADTVEDQPSEEPDRRSAFSLWSQFALFGGVVSCGGWVIARAAEGIVAATPLEQSIVGGVLMGATNAIPETVTAIAAVRRGALTLAVGGVLGGNAFDALNLAVGDVAFRAGSLYHHASADDLLLTSATLLMTAVLLAGLVSRERRGPGNIGVEGWLMLAIYGAVIATLAF